ncbi:MAG: Grx4 family monothiol glutaredoxin [Spirochaetaceae bacterium]|nr:Grx4 family monothiol glutaredoxin [Myxococcales bacterium]MCB9724841.1 Grx4 family monothiol glutaredoxin [Spirochaetaceae bacterium]HPG24165.1 Grx4 family monothiol glutaredoxin [Myxococcota bacterium]
MALDDAVRQEISQLIESHPVLLFMKGNRRSPQCGFSATVVGILDSVLPEYHTVDVLSAPHIREGIKEFSSWPTIPQLYVRGEFVGGCDIVQEMLGTGELYEALGLEPVEVVQPKIEVTPVALAALEQAIAEHGGAGRELHLSVDATYQAHLSIAPRTRADVEAIAPGITLLLDPISASRADGIRIDVADTPNGQAFRVDNPNAPRVQTMTVRELRAALDAGDPMELLDVRTPEERAIAAIPGAVLLNEMVAARIESLPRDTRLVLHCHHGGRSQQAAEQFVALGFTRVYNVVGGIDAWSQEIDPEVPRY